MTCPTCDGRGEHEAARPFVDWPDPYGWTYEVEIITVPCTDCQTNTPPGTAPQAA